LEGRRGFQVGFITARSALLLEMVVRLGMPGGAMGRVKRYKKIKACDPFAPSRAPQAEEDRDLPPAQSEEEDYEGGK
jgi:hypothetical protein